MTITQCDYGLCWPASGSNTVIDRHCVLCLIDIPDLSALYHTVWIIRFVETLVCNVVIGQTPASQSEIYYTVNCTHYTDATIIYYILVTTSINPDYSFKFYLQVVSRQPLAQRLHLDFSHLDCIKVLLTLLVFKLLTSLHAFFPFFPFVPLVVMVCRDLSHSWLSFTWACAARRGGLSKESPAPLILPPPQRWKKKKATKQNRKERPSYYQY